jgi:tol-pal system protein YbgF
MHKIKKLYIAILFIFGISVIFSSCSAPQYDEDFLKDDEANSYENLIIHPGMDSTITLKIDTLSQQMTSFLENASHKTGDKEYQQKIDSILKDLMEIKRSFSTPVVVDKRDNGKLDALEKKDIEISKRLDKLEKKIKEYSNKVAKEPASKTPSRVVNTFDDFNANYDLAINQFKARKYDDAINTFQNLLSARLQKPDLMDNIHYWLGQCNFAKGDYRKSIDNFKKVLTFPRADKVDETLMMMGYAYEKMNNVEDARESYQRLIDSYPKSRQAKKAKSKLKNLI